MEVGGGRSLRHRAPNRAPTMHLMLHGGHSLLDDKASTSRSRSTSGRCITLTCVLLQELDHLDGSPACNSLR